MNVYWDTDEPRLLAIESKTVCQQQTKSKESTNSYSGNTSGLNNLIESEAMIMFYSDKDKLYLLESINLSSGEQLVNLCVPNVVSKIKYVFDSVT